MKAFSSWQTAGLMTGLMLGVLLVLMDQTVVGTALPTVVSDLGGLGLYTWVFSAYLLTQTCFLPIFGKLSDLYGRRFFFLLGLGFFMGGSILCGQAQTMEQLIFFRALQGVGGAGLLPIALAVVGYHYDLKERARLQGIVGSAAGIAVVIGPTVGSLIVENLSWRWIFYINLPLGVLSALFIITFLWESRDTKADPVIDYVGAFTLIGWVVSLMLAFFYSQDYPWTSPQIVGLLSAFAVLFILFFRNEAHAREPILPLRIFTQRTVAAAAAVALIRAVPFYLMIAYIPLLVQGVLGGTSQGARNALTVYSLPLILAALLTGFLIARNASYRLLTTSGLALFGVGLWLVSQIGTTSGQSELLPDLVLAGVGVGLTITTIILAFQNSVPRQYMGIASSLTQFLSNLSATVGLSLLGIYQSSLLADGVKNILTSGQLPPQVAQLLADPANLGRVLTNPAVAARLPIQVMGSLRTILENSLQSVFEVGLVLTAVALIVSLFMRGSSSSAMKIAKGNHRLSANMTQHYWCAFADLHVLDGFDDQGQLSGSL